MDTRNAPHREDAVFLGHMLRSFLGTFSLTIWFFAIAYLPLGTSMTLNYTSPLYMALIVAALALRRGERLDWRAIAAVVAGFAGVTLVLKPELHSGQEIPALVGLSSGFFSALAYFQIRQLTNLREPDWRIVFYFTLFGTVWGGAGQLLLSHGFTPLSAENVPALLGMGLCATGAQLAMTRAWGSENILLSAVFQYAAIIFAAVFGVFFFKETIGLASAAGIAVILVSGVWAAWSSRRAKAKAG
jgi:S-adenosylmethionine uptake transporter